MSVADRFKLQNKVALVTGGGRNLGRAIALSLAEAGADVVLTGRSLPEMEKAAEEIRKLGQKALAIVMDVTNLSQIEEAVQKIISAFGRIDILVNNAATRSHKPLLEISEAEWRSVIDTNLTGAFLCCKAVGPYMVRQGGGRVINISSRAGTRGRADVSAYCASKGGLNQLTQALALEWAPYGILVNAVAPGIINTDRSYEGATAIPSIPRERVAAIPLKRAAEISEILPLVLYFASEACSYTTGQIVLIDGGSSAQ
ncbi:MAG: SDR family oxidoreductase [Deltaproteobacteria bacterium]|nr:SDR family oxidoreductase [Deltaproteobacteria bacterium]